MSLIFSPIRLFVLVLIGLTMFTTFWWAGATLASLMVFFSFFYYYTIIRILFTLDEARLSDDKEKVQDIMLSNATNITAAVALYKLTSFGYVALWCAPWLFMALCTNIFLLLVVYEYVEIKYKDEE
jgi:hypothetical protein